MFAAYVGFFSLVFLCCVMLRHCSFVVIRVDLCQCRWRCIVAVAPMARRLLIESSMGPEYALRWVMRWRLERPRALPMDDDIARAMAAFNSVGSISSS